MKKGQQSPVSSLQTERHGGGGWTHWGQCRQSDGCFLPILFASKSLAGLGLPPDSCFSPHGPSSACLRLLPLSNVGLEKCSLPASLKGAHLGHHIISPAHLRTVNICGYGG